MTVTDEDATIDALIALEGSRCQALADGNTTLLEQLVSDDLVHVHGDGTTHNRDEYFAHLAKSVERSTERGELDVRVYGDVAVITGPMVTTIRRAVGEPRRQMTGVATQVWRHDGENWRQTTFHATATQPAVELDD